jgi:hypothetical protein
MEINKTGTKLENKKKDILERGHFLTLTVFSYIMHTLHETKTTL